MREKNKLFFCFKLDYETNPWAVGVLPPEREEEYRFHLKLRDWHHFPSWESARDWANEKWKELQNASKG